VGVLGSEFFVDDDGGGRARKRRPTLVGVGGEAQVRSGGLLDEAHAADNSVDVAQQAGRGASGSEPVGELSQLQGVFFFLP
jgi:hypothetical protein